MATVVDCGTSVLVLFLENTDFSKDHSPALWSSGEETDSSAGFSLRQQHGISSSLLHSNGQILASAEHKPLSYRLPRAGEASLSSSPFLWQFPCHFNMQQSRVPESLISGKELINPWRFSSLYSEYELHHDVFSALNVVQEKLCRFPKETCIRLGRTTFCVLIHKSSYCKQKACCSQISW